MVKLMVKIHGELMVKIDGQTDGQNSW